MRTATNGPMVLSAVLLTVACQGSSAANTEPSPTLVSGTVRPSATTTTIALSDAQRAWCDLVGHPENSEALVEAAIAVNAPRGEDLEVALVDAGELRSKFPEGDPAGQQVFETTLVTALFDWFENTGANAFRRACTSAYRSR